MVDEKVIVRFNRSGNRSNDRAERSLRTIGLRPGLNRSIVGGEGLRPLSVADQQVLRTKGVV